MSKKIRKAKPDDHENIQKAYELIIELMRFNPQIEASLWPGALFSNLVAGYENSGFSFRDFEYEILSMLKHAETWWEE